VFAAKEPPANTWTETKRGRNIYMASVVYYRVTMRLTLQKTNNYLHEQFKTEKAFARVTFEGTGITVGDLKRAIGKQKHLAGFDLRIVNAQTGEGPLIQMVLFTRNFFYRLPERPISNCP
jgi:hypothetical protein